MEAFLSSEEPLMGLSPPVSLPRRGMERQIPKQKREQTIKKEGKGKQRKERESAGLLPSTAFHCPLRGGEAKKRVFFFREAEGNSPISDFVS